MSTLSHAVVPLDGIRVLDLSQHLPGPHLTRILADYGASVVKVESPGGDPSRFIPPFVNSTSATFAGMNFGKRSVVIDLKRPQGTTALAFLAEHCDVLVESFRPGVLDRLGVGYEVLSAQNPALIMASITGFGQTGGFCQRPGHDANYLARSGVLGVRGPAGQAPALGGDQAADIVGGSLHGAIAVMGALLARTQSNRGCHLDVSMTRGAFSLLALELPRQTCLGATPEPRGAGLLSGVWPAYDVYPTADGRYLTVCGIEPKFFGAMCQMLEMPELSGLGLATGQEGEATKERLRAKFVEHDLDHWVAFFGDSPVCCEPVLTPSEAAAGTEFDVPVVDLGGTKAVSFALGPDIDVSVPALGEHSTEVMGEWGCDTDTIASWAKAGVFGS